MKIYLIQVGCYEDTTIIGAFFKKEKAIKFIKAREIDDGISNAKIIETDLDSLGRKDGKIVFRVSVVFTNLGGIGINCNWIFANNYDDIQEDLFNKNKISILRDNKKQREFYGIIIAKNSNEAKRFLIKKAKEYNKENLLLWEEEKWKVK